MKRRWLRVAGGLIWVVAVMTVAAAVARAFSPSGWTRVPAVTVVVSAPDDPRIPTVREAIAYWNQTFADLGTPFRLGAITLVNGTLPDSDMRALSDASLHHSWYVTLPGSAAQFPGDLLVVLSDASFISFAAQGSGRTLVGIKNAPFLLNTPNVLRNVVAHELGHAVGLRHNDDPTLLMCGRPAPCRPDVYQSDTPHFFPLSAAEKDRLRALYPPDWAAH